MSDRIERVYGLVSRWPTVAEIYECDGIKIIAFSPSGEDPLVALADGWCGPQNHGSMRSPAKLLADSWYTRTVVDGRDVWELEPPGWFDRFCAHLECPWFPDVVRRVAAGGIVTLEELQGMYRLHTKREMPTGTWRQLSDAWHTARAKNEVT
jgi:hypothetical protein